MVLLGVQIHRAGRRVFHRLLHHAPEEKPRHRRAGAGEGRTGVRRFDDPADRSQGTAAGLQQGHAGGQGSDFRRAGHGVHVPDRVYPHGGHHEGAAGQHAAGGGGWFHQRHRLRRLSGGQGVALPGRLQGHRHPGGPVHRAGPDAGDLAAGGLPGGVRAV